MIVSDDVVTDVPVLDAPLMQWSMVDGDKKKM